MTDPVQSLRRQIVVLWCACAVLGVCVLVLLLRPPRVIERFVAEGRAKQPVNNPIPAAPAAMDLERIRMMDANGNSRIELSATDGIVFRDADGVPQIEIRSMPDIAEIVLRRGNGDDLREALRIIGTDDDARIELYRREIGRRGLPVDPLVTLGIRQSKDDVELGQLTLGRYRAVSRYVDFTQVVSSGPGFGAYNATGHVGEIVPIRDR